MSRADLEKIRAELRKIARVHRAAILREMGIAIPPDWRGLVVTQRKAEPPDSMKDVICRWRVTPMAQFHGPPSEGDDFEIDDGRLELYDENDYLIEAWPPGTWQRVYRVLYRRDPENGTLIPTQENPT